MVVSLMDRMPGFQSGSATSQMAAQAVRPIRRKQALRILDLFLEGGEHSTNDVVNTLGLLHQSASARMSELAKAGCILDTGRTRLTKAGKKPAALWKVSPTASEAKFVAWLKNEKASKINLKAWKVELEKAARAYAKQPTALARYELLNIATQSPSVDDGESFQ